MNGRVRTGWWLIGGVLVIGAAAAALALSGFNLGGNEAPAAKSPTARAATAKPAAKPDVPPPAAPAEAGPKTVAVSVAPITIRPLQRTVDVVGTFEAYEDVTVTPKVGGQVVKIHADQGDAVASGDVLLEIDPTDYRLAVDEGRRELQSELAKIGLSALPEQELDVAQLPTVARAMWVEQNAEQRLRRTRQLLERKTVTQEDFDQAETDYRVAQATHRQAAMDARAILASARHKAALLATAQQRLADTRIVVPEPVLVPKNQVGKGEYVVAERLVSEGEMVSAGMPGGVFRLVMDKTLKLLAAVPERYVGEVRLEQAAEVAVEAYPQRKFQGAVTRISPTVDRTSRTFQIEVQVPNDRRELKAGGFAKLSVLTFIDPSAKTVPVEALVSFAGVNKVFTLRDGKAHAVAVTPGMAGRGWIEIRDNDLTADDLVITSGHGQLAEGSPLRVRKTDDRGK